MKQELAMFVVEAALKGTKVAFDARYGNLGFFNPYQQFPKFERHRKLRYMDRPLFEGHKTYPHLSRPATANMSLLVLNKTMVPAAIAGVSVIGGTVVHQTYSTLEPENVNEKTPFWQGLAAALSGGFSMGGGVKIR